MKINGSPKVQIVHVKSDQTGNWYPELHREYTYDSCGNVLSCVEILTHENSPESYNHDKIMYRYDSENREIECISYNWSNGWYKSIKHTIEYDRDGRKKKLSEYEWSPYSEMWKELGSHTFKYDIWGVLIEDHYYLEGSLFSKTIFKYDSNGNKVEEIEHSWDIFTEKLALKYRTVYTYDSSNFLIKKSTYANRSDFECWEETNRVLYQNDFKGNVIVYESFNCEGRSLRNVIETRFSYEY